MLTVHFHNKLSLLLVCCCLAPSLQAAEPKVVASRTKNVTVPIDKTVPVHIVTTKAPDVDSKHYRTLEGTRFSYRCHVPYTLKTKQAAVEVCEIDPVTLEILSWPETEVINLIEGAVTVTEANGDSKNYAAGDIFVLPQGFKGVWRQSGRLSKVVVRHPLYWKD
jgi:hypothetical protein